MMLNLFLTIVLAVIHCKILRLVFYPHSNLNMLRCISELFGKPKKSETPRARRTDQNAVHRMRAESWRLARAAWEVGMQKHKPKRRGYRAPDFDLDDDEDDVFRVLYPVPEYRTCLHSENCLTRGCSEHGSVPEMFHWVYKIPICEPSLYKNKIVRYY